MDKDKIAKRLLAIIFDESGNEGISVYDVEEITQEMISKMKETRMILYEEKAEMEAKREKAEKVQCDVRERKGERTENGADSDNGQPDGSADRIPDVREKENQSVICESNKGGWRERVLQHFLRVH